MNENVEKRKAFEQHILEECINQGFSISDIVKMPVEFKILVEEKVQEHCENSLLTISK